MNTVEWADEWSRVSSLLCIRIGSAAQALLTTPALAAAKGGIGPCGQLTFLTTPEGADLVDLIHEVDHTIAYGKTSRPGHADRDIVERLREQRFDAAVIFTEYGQSPFRAAQLCVLAGIPLRLGCSREDPHHLLTHWVPDRAAEDFYRHDVQRQLDLLAEVGWHVADERLRLRVHPAAAARMDRLLRSEGIDRRQCPWVLVHPGAGAPSRHYPAPLFARVAKKLTQGLGLQIVFTGSAQDTDLIESIRSELEYPGVSLAGMTTLSELIATIHCAPVVLTNRALPAHIAASVSTPAVVLYALTDPRHTPWHAESQVLFHDVPCRYCEDDFCHTGDLRCLSGIEPTAVVAAVNDVLATTAWPPRPSLRNCGAGIGVPVDEAFPKELPVAM